MHVEAITAEPGCYAADNLPPPVRRLDCVKSGLIDNQARIKKKELKMFTNVLVSDPLKDIFREMGLLDNELFPFAGGYRQPRAVEFPAINVYESADNLVVTAELPGVDPEKIDISHKGDKLNPPPEVTITGASGRAVILKKSSNCRLRWAQTMWKPN